MSHRRARVARELRSRLAEVLTRRVRDPRLELVTVTDLEVSPDFSLARVYYRALEKSETIQVAFDKAKPFIRRELAVGLELRRVPELVFIPDPTPERAARVEAILDELEEERQGRAVGDAEPEEG